MFLTDKFLRYGRPMAAAAPLMLGLMGLATPAHACTGSANDPVHCINNGQAINGIGDFITNNLQGVPGSTTVPGDAVQGDPADSFLDGLFGLALDPDENGLRRVEDPGSEILFGRGIELDNGLRIGGPVSFGDDRGAYSDTDLSVFLSGDFGTVTMGDNDGGRDWALRGRDGNVLDDVEVDIKFNYVGVADNGLRYGFDINLTEDGDGASGSTGDRGLTYDRGFQVGNFVSTDFDGVDVGINNENYVRPTITLDNGIRISANLQIEGESSTDGGVNEPAVVIRGSFGTLVLDDDVVGPKTVDLGAPRTEPDEFVFRPQVTLDNGLTIAVDPTRGVGSAGNYSTSANDDAKRITYFTPRFAGFQLGVDYSGQTTSESTDSGLGNTFDIRNSYVSTFGGFDASLSERWDGLGASLNYAVGSASLANYGGIEGANVERFNYIPIEGEGLGSKIGLDVRYNLDGGGGVSFGEIPTSGASTTRQPATIPSPPVTGDQIGESAFNN